MFGAHDRAWKVLHLILIPLISLQNYTSLHHIYPHPYPHPKHTHTEIENEKYTQLNLKWHQLAKASFTYQDTNHAVVWDSIPDMVHCCKWRSLETKSKNYLFSNEHLFWKQLTILINWVPHNIYLLTEQFFTSASYWDATIEVLLRDTFPTTKHPSRSLALKSGPVTINWEIS